MHRRGHTHNPRQRDSAECRLDQPEDDDDAGAHVRFAIQASVRALVACLFLVLASTSPASAATGHKFLSSISEAGPGSALVEPGSVTVERSTGKVLLADPGSGKVDVFSPSGTFETEFGEGLEPVGVAVDETTHDVYVADAFGDVVDVFKPNGAGGYDLLSEWSGTATSQGEFGEVSGVAVDNSKSASAGDVYVVDSSDGGVDVFKPKPVGIEEDQEGAFVRTISAGGLEEPNGVAVDAGTGGVYVADSAKGAVDIYSPLGAFESKLTGAGSPEGTFRGSEGEEGNVRAVSVDETTGDVYVAESERHVVSQFNANGEWIGWITTTPTLSLGTPKGVALTPSGEVYVAQAEGAGLDVFGSGVVVPDAKSTTATKISKTSALLNGVVNGDGKPAKYHFEWGTTEDYGASTPPTGAGSGEEKVAAALGALDAGTVYHFRLVTENENGTNVGADREFTTPPAVEALSTGPAEDVKSTGATLTGSLTPKGAETHYYFEWGTTTAYGEKSPSPPGTDAGAGSEPVATATELSSLTPNTSYHYRLVGTDEFGTTTGEDRRFTTPGPPRITSEPTTGIGHETATINAKLDPDELASDYHFEYGESTAYGTEVPLGGANVPAGETPVAISAALSGLKIGVTYHFRVVSTNGDGTTLGPDQVFTTVPPALIESESAEGVSSAAATLRAQINPLGHGTTYFFQYGTESCATNPAACTDIPLAPGEEIGESETGQIVHQRIEDLQVATTYHYRVLAINSLGTAGGPEHTITTEEAETPFALADDRAWELVSPPNKHGAPIEALTREGGLILAAEDGDSFAYVANGSIVEEPQSNRSPEMQQVISTRGAQSWSTEDIATPSSRAEGITGGQAPEYQFFTPDLATALVEPAGTTEFSEPPLAPEAKQRTMYLRDDLAGAYAPIVTEANVPPGTEFGGKMHFLAATADLSHVLLRSEATLTPQPAGKGLYEWSGGTLQFVSLLPTGTPASEAELGFDSHVLAHAVSSNGERVVWTSREEGTGAGHLYMRDTATGETVQLDAAQDTIEPSKGSAEFQTASDDASKVFFTDKQRLTADSTSESTFPGKADLYECEMIEEPSGKLACHLKDLTVDHVEGPSAAVQGFLLGAGEGGDDVYLVAHGVLAANENGNGEKAEAERENLYHLHYDGTQWTTTFIGELSSEDSAEWEGNKVADTAFLTARVSPNGRYLAFMSAASPTGYDNVDANPEAKGARDEEVYLFDANTTSLTCVSCDPTGARPVGVLDTEEAGEGLGLVVDRRKDWTGHWLAGNIPGWTAQSLLSALFQSRYLSDSGRLFFNSADALVPQVSTRTREEETPGRQKLRVGVENVYEFEPAGLGSCESSTGGCVSLISSGGSAKESAFLEATPSGNDAFFLTAAQLLPQDTDTAFDVYDARVCAQASPCLGAPPPPQPGCTAASACRPAQPSQQAPIAPAGTAIVSAPGAVTPSPPKQSPPAVKVTAPKPLTRAQKLANAMKACKKLRDEKKRAKCQATAKKKYGTKKAKKTNGPAKRGRH